MFRYKSNKIKERLKRVEEESASHVAIIARRFWPADAGVVKFGG
jgi:hypothetical protein